MYNLYPRFKVIALPAIMAFLVSCGGGSGSSLFGHYSIDDVNILADNIQVGESVRAEVFFETKTESDGVPDGLDVVVRIPAELNYIRGTSQLYDGGTSDSDSYTPNDIVNCETGETYLVYNFADFDLFEHEVGGFGKFGFKFEVRGVSSTPETFIAASAGSNEEFHCGEAFVSEGNEAVQVSR